MLSEKPWKLEPVARVLMGIGICVCSAWFVAGLVDYFAGGKEPDENSLAFLVPMTLGLQGSILAVVAGFLWWERIGWAEAFGIRRAGLAGALLVGVVIGVAFLPAGLTLQWSSLKALELLHFKAPEQQAVQTLRNAMPGASRIYFVIFTVLIAPPAEEMVFRGILYPAIKQIGFPRTALWGSSLLFGLIHVNLPTFVPLTVLGLVLVWLYEWTDNLAACIFAHATFNAANIMLLYLWR
jgi:membrane protease YdiL (CAAX protease family)